MKRILSLSTAMLALLLVIGAAVHAEEQRLDARRRLEEITELMRRYRN